MKKIVYVCCYSNHEVREKLNFSKFTFSNILRKYLGIPSISFMDNAPWNTEFIKGFEADKKHQYYVISPHIGLRRKVESFMDKGITYYFYKQRTSFADRFANKFLGWDMLTDYKHYRNIVNRIIKKIDPDLIVVCGAENPIYSFVAIDNLDRPVFLILQTLLNSEKRVKLSVGTPYRRKVEEKILSSVHYFADMEDETIKYLQEHNSNYKCFYFNFPIRKPTTFLNVKKEYDYLFFARGISKFKGIEDTIKAFSIVHNKYPDLTLNISGGCDANYKLYLQSLIDKFGCTESVSWQNYFANHDEVFLQLQKAKVIVVPGITAGMNSTVKEAMMLGLPTVVYETSVISNVNLKSHCLFVAKMEDVKSLAEQMLLSFEEKELCTTVAKNGSEYALANFDSSAASKRLILLFDAAISHYYNKKEIPNSLLCH